MSKTLVSGSWVIFGIFVFVASCFQLKMFMERVLYFFNLKGRTPILRSSFYFFVFLKILFCNGFDLCCKCYPGSTLKFSHSWVSLKLFVWLDLFPPMLIFSLTAFTEGPFSTGLYIIKSLVFSQWFCHPPSFFRRISLVPSHFSSLMSPRFSSSEWKGGRLSGCAIVCLISSLCKLNKTLKALIEGTVSLCKPWNCRLNIRIPNVEKFVLVDMWHVFFFVLFFFLKCEN